MNRKRIVRNRFAFTLVELLVVITIIGMLMALLLPAVQAAREAGRRATCMSNQKNVALAMLNFESTKKHYAGYLNGFPMGFTTETSGTQVITHVLTAPVSWVVTILPYLERRDISDQYKAYLTGTGTSTLDQFSGTSMNVLLCPSDPPDTSGPNLAFVVNRGINGEDSTPAYGVCFDLSKSGNSAVSADYISAHDGTSTTLLVSETLLSPGGASGPATGTVGPPRLQLIAADDTTAYYFRPLSKWFDTANTDTKTSPLSWKNGNSILIDGTDCDSRAELSLAFEWGAMNINSPAMVSQQINSRHGGLIHVSFCDGHQWALREDIEPNVYKHLMTPDSAATTALLGIPAGPVGVLNENAL